MKKSLIILGIPLLAFWMHSSGQDSAEVKSMLSPVDSNGLKKEISSTGSCMDCHSALQEKKYKHNPKSEKKCADCHQSNGIVHPTARIGLIKNPPDLCLSCHEEKSELISSAPFVHTALSDKRSCLACHNPHSSDVKKLLVSSRKELCLSCHNKSVDENSKKVTNFEKLMTNSKVLHSPFEDCEKVCHNPHASSDSRLLDLALPTDNYLVTNTDAFELCWECHASDMITKPVSKGATNFRNGESNLHYVHIHGEKGRSCMVCHSPHATMNDHLIRDNVHFGSWEFRMNYKADDTGGSCAPACHTEKRYTR